MKLPVINERRQVQSLGREDIYAPQRVAGAEARAAQYEGAGMRAMGKGLGMLGEVLTQQADEMAGHEAQMAFLDFERQLQNRTLQRQQQRYLGEDQVPDSVSTSESFDTHVAEPSGQVSTTSKPLPWWQVGIQSFDADSEALYTAAYENLSTAKAKEIFGAAAMKHITRRRGVVAAEATRQLREDIAGQTELQIEELAKEGNYDGAMALVRQRVGSIYSPSEAQKMINTLSTRKEVDPIMLSMANNDMDAMGTQYQLLTSDTYTGTLAPDDRRALANDLRAQMNKVEADQLEATSFERAQAASALGVKVDEGTATQYEIDEALKNKVITGAQHNSYTRNLRKNQKKAIAASQLNTQIAYSIANGVPLDGNDKDVKKGVDAVYKKNRNLDGGLAIMKSTRVLPASLESDVMRLSQSDKTEDVVRAANFYNAAQDNGVGYMLDKLDQKSIAVMESTANNIAAGMPPDQAVALARNSANLDDATKDGLKTLYKEHRTENAEELQSLVNSADWTDIAIMGEPRVPPKFMGLFESLVEQQFNYNGGDIELARSAAFKQLEARWGGTAVGNVEKQRLIEYPPERLYAVPTDVLQEELNEQLTLNGVPLDNHFIASDGATIQNPTANGYPVFTMNEFGQPTQAMDRNGMPMRWLPNIKRMAQMRREASIREAQEEREERALVREAEREGAPVGTLRLPRPEGAPARKEGPDPLKVLQEQRDALDAGEAPRI